MKVEGIEKIVKDLVRGELWWKIKIYNVLNLKNWKRVVEIGKLVCKVVVRRERVYLGLLRGSLDY